MAEIVNAKITSTMLGLEDHGIMTCTLFLEFANGGCGYGGYALDTYDEVKKMRVGTAAGLDAIMQLMKTLEVEKWEDLKGKYVRCETTGWGGTVTNIGHLIKNKWFSFKEFFDECKQP